ncbi:type II toxin-antitoxin system YafQ family toxin [Patescibacteria group bacterium]
MYQLTAYKEFLNRSKKFVKNNPQNKQKLNKALKKLAKNPFHASLKTHKVSHKLIGKAYSSWVTGDIRIIWDFTQEKSPKILLINLGGHSGKDKVYR